MTMIDQSLGAERSDTRSVNADELARVRRLRAVRKPEVKSPKSELKARIKKLHIPDENWHRAKNAFDSVVAQSAEVDQEGTCVVVSGPPGGGKTHQMGRFMSRPELQPTKDEHGPLRPVLYVLTPSACSEGRLGECAFRNLTGREITGRPSVSQIWEAVGAQMRGQGTSILVFDEFHHLFGQNDPQKRKHVLERIKTLLLPEEQMSPTAPRKLPVQVVIGGLPLVKEVLVSDSQMTLRADFVDIHPLKFTQDGIDEMQNFLKLMEPRLEFQNPCHLDTYEMALCFMKASSGYVGRAARILKKAVYRAIDQEKSCIGKAELGAVLRSSYNLANEKNPFLVADVSNCPVLVPRDPSARTLLKGKKAKEENHDDDL